MSRYITDDQWERARRARQRTPEEPEPFWQTLGVGLLLVAMLYVIVLFGAAIAAGGA